jgi:hypothetical protein
MRKPFKSGCWNGAKNMILYLKYGDRQRNPLIGVKELRRLSPYFTVNPPAGLTPSDSFPKTCDIFISIVENPKIKRMQLTYCSLSDAPENPDTKIPFGEKGFYSTYRRGHCRTNAEIDSRLGPGDSGRTGPVEPENKETIKSSI